MMIQMTLKGQLSLNARRYWSYVHIVVQRMSKGSHIVPIVMENCRDQFPRPFYDPDLMLGETLFSSPSFSVLSPDSRVDFRLLSGSRCSCSSVSLSILRRLEPDPLSIRCILLFFDSVRTDYLHPFPTLLVSPCLIIPSSGSMELDDNITLYKREWCRRRDSRPTTKCHGIS